MREPVRVFKVDRVWWRIRLVRLKELREEPIFRRWVSRTPGGLCNFKSREILVGRHASPRQRRDITIHETIHALEPKMPHKQVYRLAETLGAALDALDSAQRDL